ncbi:hypothetical protein A6R68_24077, partial [Neotoma lepida]
MLMQSRSVDKQHAVINYDASMDEHLVKDLGSLNGTFVNDHEKFTIQLQLSQKSSESEVPKSASAKGTDSKVEAAAEVQHRATEALKSEEKSMDVSAMPRGTPLYGQPSWWGDDEVDEQRALRSNGKPEEKHHDTGTS